MHSIENRRDPLGKVGYDTDDEGPELTLSLNKLEASVDTYMLRSSRKTTNTIPYGLLGVFFDNRNKGFGDEPT